MSDRVISSHTLIDHPQSGQVGIVVLLIMVVILGIAIGISRRTIQQQDIAFIQDESARVFNAAESGVEEALSRISQAEITGDELDESGSLEINENQVDFTIEVSNRFEMHVSAGDAIEIPLEDEGDVVQVSWNYQRGTNCNSDQPAALVISVISEADAKHFGFDPCESLRNTNFQTDGFNAAGNYSYSVNIDVEDTDRLLRIKPLFNSTRIFVSANNSINLAQHNIDSTGFNETEGIARSIWLRRSVPGNYSFMDYALLSGNTLTKN